MNPKTRVTVGKIIKRDGTFEWSSLIIDKNVPTLLKSKLKEEDKKVDPKDPRKNFTLFKIANTGQVDKLFAKTNSSFMNRGLFISILKRYDKWLTNGRMRRCLLLDNLASHILNKKHHDEWLKTNKHCYVDNESFKSIKLAYLPANSTGAAQPEDLGYYARVQAIYKKWFNANESKMDLLVKNAPFKRDKQILAIYGHLEDVSSAVLSTCWSSSQLASLHPKTPITGSVRELSDLRDSYQEHSEQLRG